MPCWWPSSRWRLAGGWLPAPNASFTGRQLAWGGAGARLGALRRRSRRGRDLRHRPENWARLSRRHAASACVTELQREQSRRDALCWTIDKCARWRSRPTCGGCRRDRRPDPPDPTEPCGVRRPADVVAGASVGVIRDVAGRRRVGPRRFLRSLDSWPDRTVGRRRDLPSGEHAKDPEAEAPAPSRTDRERARSRLDGRGTLHGVRARRRPRHGLHQARRLRTFGSAGRLRLWGLDASSLPAPGRR